MSSNALVANFKFTTATQDLYQELFVVAQPKMLRQLSPSANERLQATTAQALFFPRLAGTSRQAAIEHIRWDWKPLPCGLPPKKNPKALRDGNLDRLHCQPIRA